MKIEARGLNVYLDNQLVTIAGLTDFSLFYKFVKGIDIIPILKNRDQIFQETITSPFLRVLRVSSQAKNIFQMRPGDYPYTSVTAFVDFVYEEIGVAVAMEGILDNENDLNTERTHWINLVNALLRCKYGNYIPVLGNEWSKNFFYPRDFFDLRPPCFASLGSDVGDENPMIDPNNKWGLSMFHGRRDGVKCFNSSSDLAYVKFGYKGENGHPDWVGTHEPTIHEEPIGFNEFSIPNSRSSNSRVAYNIGIESASTGNGGYYHSTSGVYSEIIDKKQSPIQWESSQAFLMGLSKADPIQSWDGTI